MDHNSILIVDDNPADIFIVEKAITKTRPESVIAHATSGDEALGILRKRSTPALILLDYKMPGMSGVEVLQDIRKHGETRYVPVVMLTSSTLGSDIKAAYDAGANSYLYKSHDLGTFTEEIKSVLHYWLDLNVSLTETT
jgi:CheY-like chemotaxis protein